MKRLNLFVPILAAVAALFAGMASAADEKEDILARFDRELLIVMSGFAEAHESDLSSAFRQNYISSLNQFVSDANTLEDIISDLGIGEDLRPGTHARNIRIAFQEPVQTPAPTTSNQKNGNKNKSNTAKANDPLSCRFLLPYGRKHRSDAFLAWIRGPQRQVFGLSPLPQHPAVSGIQA